MSLTEEANCSGRSVDDCGEQIHYVASENAEVERNGINNCRETTAENNRLTGFALHLELSLDKHGIGNSADAADGFFVSSCGRSVVSRIAALNTVRSAPVSTRNSTTVRDPLPPRMRPRITGRTTPSSHSNHSPLICIDSGQLGRINIANNAACVGGVPRFGKRRGFLRRVGHK